jgi:hypothetical protein
MQVKKKTKTELKLLTLTGPVSNCSFKKECGNFKLSITRALDSGPSLDASQKENQKEFKLLTVIGLAASCSLKAECQIQALVNESFRFRPQT